VTVSYYL